MSAGDREGLVAGAGDAVDGLLQAELVQELLEPLAVFGEVDGVGRGAEDRDAFVRAAPGPASAGVWPPNCTMTPCRVPFSCSTRRISSTCSSVSGSK